MKVRKPASPARPTPAEIRRNNRHLFRRRARGAGSTAGVSVMGLLSCEIGEIQRTFSLPPAGKKQGFFYAAEDEEPNPAASAAVRAYPTISNRSRSALL